MYTEWEPVAKVRVVSRWFEVTLYMSLLSTLMVIDAIGL